MHEIGSIFVSIFMCGSMKVGLTHMHIHVYVRDRRAEKKWFPRFQLLNFDSTVDYAFLFAQII